MAVVKEGSIAAALSGTVGGITFSKTATALVARGWRAGVNKRTPAQRSHRQAFARLSSLWFATLTQVQRDAWIAYAPTVTFTNAHGDTYTLSGFQMYMRTNLYLQAPASPEDFNGPTLTGLPSSRTLTTGLTHATGVWQVTAMTPAGLAADRLFYSIINIDRVTRNLPRGKPFEFADLTGNFALPYTLHTYPSPLPGIAGDYVGWAFFWYYDSDNRITNPQLISAVSA